ncbi:MAG: hypothetical protein JW723_04495 [Bacteroidales bacterium]|nr:hypothetical protein [Bacteroidales bacterium]
MMPAGTGVTGRSLINVTFIGKSEEGTVITYDDYASRKNTVGEEIGTSGSSVFFVSGYD